MKVYPLKSGEIELVARDRYSNDRMDTAISAVKLPNQRARLAIALIEKWGMVAGVPDGEDSSGRHKVKLMTPQEVVQRACDSAQIAVDTFEVLGWFDELPSMKDIQTEDSDQLSDNPLIEG